MRGRVGKGEKGGRKGKGGREGKEGERVWGREGEWKGE